MYKDIYWYWPKCLRNYKCAKKFFYYLFFDIFISYHQT